MGRVVVAVDAGVGLGAQDFAAAWLSDGDAAALGRPTVESGEPGVFVPGVAEWVVIPLSVSVASSALYDLAKRVVASRRPPAAPTVEVTVTSQEDGTSIVVVRVAPMGSRPAAGVSDTGAR